MEDACWVHLLTKELFRASFGESYKVWTCGQLAVIFTFLGKCVDLVGCSSVQNNHLYWENSFIGTWFYNMSVCIFDNDWKLKKNMNKFYRTFEIVQFYSQKQNLRAILIINCDQFWYSLLFIFGVHLSSITIVLYLKWQNSNAAS